MTKKKTPTPVAQAARQYRALVDLALRQSSDPASPLYAEWFEWPAGTVFTPPAHMNVARALERGIVEPAGG